ncbi:MAG: pyrroline-5-carboxylate reductase [Pseudomonadota bacterium]
MSEHQVAFIGGGNMTRAIVAGLLEDGYAAAAITIAEPVADQRAVLAADFPGVYVTGDNDEAVTRANSVVLSVKPQIIADVCKQLAGAVQAARPLIISIAAGPRIADIDAWLGGDNAVVRVMPNQPALLRAGINGLHGNARTTPEQLAAATTIMSAVGPVIEVPVEKDIDAVTAVSGSGPAYIYLVIDMIARAGVELGLDADTARQLATETALGAATLASHSNESMDALIARVRSPGGTTAAALDSLESQGIRAIFLQALTAARDRATELADEAHEAGNNDNERDRH